MLVLADAQAKQAALIGEGEGQNASMLGTLLSILTAEKLGIDVKPVAAARK